MRGNVSGCGHQAIELDAGIGLLNKGYFERVNIGFDVWYLFQKARQAGYLDGQGVVWCWWRSANVIKVVMCNYGGHNGITLLVNVFQYPIDIPALEQTSVTPSINILHASPYRVNENAILCLDVHNDVYNVLHVCSKFIQLALDRVQYALFHSNVLSWNQLDDFDPHPGIVLFDQGLCNKGRYLLDVRSVFSVHCHLESLQCLIKLLQFQQGFAMTKITLPSSCVNSCPAFPRRQNHIHTLDHVLAKSMVCTASRLAFSYSLVLM